MILYCPWCGSNFGMTEPWEDDSSAKGLCATCMVRVVRGELPLEPQHLKNLSHHKKAGTNLLGGLLPPLDASEET